MNPARYRKSGRLNERSRALSWASSRICGSNWRARWRNSLRAQNEYDQAFELMFSGPYGYGSLSDIDHLNDAQFSKMLAWITLPAGTGIPFLKFIKPSTWQGLTQVQKALAHP